MGGAGAAVHHRPDGGVDRRECSVDERSRTGARVIWLVALGAICAAVVDTALRCRHSAVGAHAPRAHRRASSRQCRIWADSRRTRRCSRTSSRRRCSDAAVRRGSEARLGGEQRCIARARRGSARSCASRKRGIRRWPTWCCSCSDCGTSMCSPRSSGGSAHPARTRATGSPR